MHNAHHIGISTCLLGLSFAAALLPAAAMAQSSGETVNYTCNYISMSTMEPVGDHEGHLIQNGNYSCKAQGGNLDGLVTTGSALWEQDAGVAKSVLNTGVGRKAGGMMAYSTTEGKRSFVMKDGKIAGWIATGRSVTVGATGTLAAYAGKTFSWTSHSTGMYEFVIAATFD